MSQLNDKMQVTLVTFVSLFIISQAQNDILPQSSEQLDESWQSFKLKYNKTYQNEAEEEKRKQIFFKAIELIAQHNLNEKNSYKMSVNSFSDLTLEEFKVQMNLKPSKYWSNSTRVQSVNRPGQPNRRKSFFSPIKPAVDWRNGYVTEPIYQGRCGCCWAIAVVGAAESIHAITTGQLLPFSSQNVIDCATRPNYNSDGCNGGFLVEAITYIAQNGVADEVNCPFLGHQTGNCRDNILPKKNVPISGVRVISNENDLARAVSLGPVPVAIDADQLSFQMYSSGIYDDPFCSHNVNHAVLIVGYDSDSWIIKNSWSHLWGENGFGRIRRGKNMCGILTQALQPIF